MIFSVKISYILFIAIATLLISVAPNPTYAQKSDQKVARTPVSQPWQIFCAAQSQKGALVCAMKQTINLQQSGQKIISVELTRLPSTGDTTLQLSLPHGIDLTKPISFKVDELDVRDINVSWADQSGSYATILVDDVLLAQLKAGRSIFVGMRARAGNSLKMELSLAGFTKAFEKL